MAWVSAVFGALGGLVLAIAAGLAGSWPVWLILLLYPLAAALLMLIMLAFLFWRSSGPGGTGKRSESETGSASGSPRNLGPRLF